jgi:hypothetical protein
MDTLGVGVSFTVAQGLQHRDFFFERGLYLIGEMYLP